MSLYKETERKLKDEYERVKDYLNDEDSGCEELYLMCMNCEKFNGIKQHDYSECKDLVCFRNWLGLAYLDSITGLQ